jgi:hypothetical protein
VSYALVVVGCAAAWLIYTTTDPQALVVDVEGFSVFAPLYIAAQAIERILEPFAAKFDPTTEQKAALKRARVSLASLLALPAGDSARTADAIRSARETVETAEATLGRAKARRALLLWGAASFLSLIVCAVLGLGLVETVAKQPPESEFIRTVDVLLTGLAVGAGTKPLHDLIARIEKAKDNADAATQPATTVPPDLPPLCFGTPTSPVVT